MYQVSALMLFSPTFDALIWISSPSSLRYTQTIAPSILALALDCQPSATAIDCLLDTSAADRSPVLVAAD